MLSKLRMPWALLMGLALLFGSTACDNDDDDIVTNEDRTIVEIAASDARFSTLVGALQRTGLDAVLSDRNANFTVFAPTNDAFTALGVDLNTLTDEELSGILLYHVLGAEVLSSQIQEGTTYVSSASETGPNGAQVSLGIERAGTNITINNTAAVTAADLRGENGVIHVINSVLLPLDIVGHVAANSEFSELVTALGAASGDLVNVLGAAGQTFTVFAPTNQAFADIASVASTLTPDELAAVLTYHVVAGANATSNTLTDGQSIGTVQGESVTVNISGNTVTLTDAQGNIANVIFVDIQGTNGVIHVLDKVVLPNNI